jgi:hypothetical protein
LSESSRFFNSDGAIFANNPAWANGHEIRGLEAAIQSRFVDEYGGYTIEAAVDLSPTYRVQRPAFICQ